MGESTSNKKQLNELLTTEFVLGDAIKYFNAILNHSRFLIDILVRLGLVLILQKLSISLYTFLGILALGIAAIVFIIRATWRDEQHNSLENATHSEIKIHPNSQDYLFDLNNRIKYMLDSERNYINNVTNFLDVNMFCTFLFFVISCYSPITTKVVIGVFITSFVSATFLHRYLWLQNMQKEDNDFIEQIDKIQKKCATSEQSENLNLKPGPTLSMLLVHATFLSSLSLSLLIMLPENTTVILIELLTRNLWLSSLPAALVVFGLYFSSKFRQVVFSGASMFSTTSVLILMGYKYLDLFPIAHNVLLYHIGPLHIFKVACLFVGVLTGLISYRTFVRTENITDILESAKPVKSNSLEKPPTGSAQPPGLNPASGNVPTSTNKIVKD